uniref:SFRICE_026965 n=1 Tax=Spodoptera frugiperda TaxID=7108 RepID=A0A2H1WW25_SPOFR
MSDFVSLNLGFNHLTVQDVASRNKIIPEGLFSNPDLSPDVKPAIVICDATYVFVLIYKN